MRTSYMLSEKDQASNEEMMEKLGSLKILPCLPK
jgi:hypothetical protein